MRGKRIFFFLFLALFIAGCSAVLSYSNKEEKPGKFADIPVSIECTTAYRASVTQPIERTEVITLSPEKENQEVPFSDLIFHTWYSDGSAYELRSLKVWVTTVDAQEELSSVLYQLSKSETIKNQVIEHGFTGLHYVYHPVSRSEIQFWCSVK